MAPRLAAGSSSFFSPAPDHRFLNAFSTGGGNVVLRSTMTGITRSASTWTPYVDACVGKIFYACGIQLRAAGAAANRLNHRC
jgi:hypothetical protein